MKFSAVRLSSLLLAASAAMLLAGCESTQVNKADVMTSPHFWERADATSAIYQRGPKAQQMLNRDISRCVVEIRELEHLGAIRRATPAELAEQAANGGVDPNDPNSPPGALARYETPDHEGALRAEFLPYHDFETCMINKGWQRVEHVPYDVGTEARDVYLNTILGEKYRTKNDLRNAQPELQPVAESPASNTND